MVIIFGVLMLIRTNRINLRLRHYGPLAIVALCLFMLYFPWGYALHTSIAVPATLGWILFGGALLMMSGGRLAFYHSPLLFSAILALLLPVLWMSPEADVWRTIPRLIAMVTGIILLCRLGSITISETQAKSVVSAMVVAGLFCAVSVF